MRNGKWQINSSEIFHFSFSICHLPLGGAEPAAFPTYQINEEEHLELNRPIDNRQPTIGNRSGLPLNRKLAISNRNFLILPKGATKHVSPTPWSPTRNLHAELYWNGDGPGSEFSSNHRCNK